MNDKATPANRMYVSTGSAATSGTTVIRGSTPPRAYGPVQSNVEGAVYSYIQAMRALGKTQINTIEISKALNLPVSAVNDAVASLRDKGVKPL